MVNKCENLPGLFYVISHERSGTHFVINTIFKNCRNISELHNIGEWFGPYWDRSSRFDHITEFNKTIFSKHGIIKSHCDFDLFTARYVALPVIYVVRDPRDTMVSWWHYLNNDFYYKYNQNVPDHRSTSISEFISRPVSDFLRFCYSLNGRFTNVIERWAAHVSGWEKSGNVFVVRYEDLKIAFSETINKIAKYLSLDLIQNLEEVKFGEGLCHLPRKGVIGDWKNCLSEHDLDLIDLIVKKYKLKKYYFTSF